MLVLRRVEGTRKDTWQREFKLPWREAGQPIHHDDEVDSDRKIVDKELSLSATEFNTVGC